ncbi:MAG: IBR domain-containing protein [Planctomycetaceae bacterium]|nr:IBR domain-containing protein [Planctomycetaceae bacterium]
MSRIISCPQTGCGNQYQIEETQKYATCPRCGYWYRIQSEGGPVAGIFLWYILTCFRLVVVLWLPIAVIGGALSAMGLTSRPLLAVGSVLIPVLAIWYWIEDRRRRATGNSLALPQWLVGGMHFIGQALRWGFGWFLTSFGQSLYYLFLKATGQRPGHPDESTRRIPYGVVFAAGYSLAFVLFSILFVFVWETPPKEQLFLFNFLTLGMSVETSLSVGFVLSLVVWPVLLVIESIMPVKPSNT